MKTRKTLLLWLSLACATFSIQAQGTFQNLGFELANVPDVPNGQSGGSVATADGIPSWTAFYAFNQTTQILHNDFSVGSVNISVLGPNWNGSFGLSIPDGNYCVILQAGAGATGAESAAIAQTGVVPSAAQSLQFKAYRSNPNSEFGITIGGQNIAMIPLFQTANYTLYGGDISVFANQSVELKIAAVPTSSFAFSTVTIDSIVFSSQSVPEPDALGLVALGGLLLGGQLRKRSRL